MDLTPVEIRVLGCLIEKQRTTPDAYPLSLNGLRAACNQATNRDPVVEYDESVIREALTRLGRRRYTRLTSTQGSRAAKFRHLLDETLGLRADEQAVLAVLMLRGPQTPGELRARTERLHPFPDAASLQGVLERLMERRLVQRLDRRPGQKEERYTQLLGGGPSAAAGGSPAAMGAASPGVGTASPAGSAPLAGEVARSAGGVAAEPSASAGLAPGGEAPAQGAGSAEAGFDRDSDDRLERLERRVAELTEEVAALRATVEGGEPAARLPAD